MTKIIKPAYHRIYNRVSPVWAAGLLVVLSAAPVHARPTDAKTRLYQKLAELSSGDKVQKLIHDEDKRLTILLYPKNPVFKDSALIEILEATGAINTDGKLKETVITYEGSNKEYLTVHLTITSQNWVNTEPSDKHELFSSSVQVPVKGDLEKQGRLPLVYNDYKGDLVTINEQFHLLLTHFPSKRVLVQLKSNDF